MHTRTAGRELDMTFIFRFLFVILGLVVSVLMNATTTAATVTSITNNQSFLHSDTLYPSGILVSGTKASANGYLELYLNNQTQPFWRDTDATAIFSTNLHKLGCGNHRITASEWVKDANGNKSGSPSNSSVNFIVSSCPQVSINKTVTNTTSPSRNAGSQAQPGDILRYVISVTGDQSLGLTDAQFVDHIGSDECYIRSTFQSPAFPGSGSSGPSTNWSNSFFNTTNLASPTTESAVSIANPSATCDQNTNLQTTLRSRGVNIPLSMSPSSAATANPALQAPITAGTSGGDGTTPLMFRNENTGATEGCAAHHPYDHSLNKSDIYCIDMEDASVTLDGGYLSTCGATDGTGVGPMGTIASPSSTCPANLIGAYRRTFWRDPTTGYFWSNVTRHHNMNPALNPDLPIAGDSGSGVVCFNPHTKANCGYYEVETSTIPISLYAFSGAQLYGGSAIMSPGYVINRKMYYTTVRANANINPTNLSLVMNCFDFATMTNCTTGDNITIFTDNSASCNNVACVILEPIDGFRQQGNRFVGSVQDDTGSGYTGYFYCVDPTNSPTYTCSGWTSIREVAAIPAYAGVSSWSSYAHPTIANTVCYQIGGYANRQCKNFTNQATALFAESVLPGPYDITNIMTDYGTDNYTDYPDKLARLELR